MYRLSVPSGISSAFSFSPVRDRKEKFLLAGCDLVRRGPKSDRATVNLAKLMNLVERRLAR